MRSVRLNLLVNAHRAQEPYPVALFITRVPVYTLQREPASVGAEPIYPAEVRNEIASDTIDVAFVVDERGRALDSTAEFHAGRFREYSREMLHWLPRARFRPARANGCAVPMLTHRLEDFHSHFSVH